MRTIESIQGILDLCTYPMMEFEVHGGDVPYMQVSAPAGTDTQTGKPMPWKGRKWQLSYHMTDTEIVQTAWAAIQRALMHEASELFKFDDVAIFDRHIDVHRLVNLAKGGANLDGREAPSGWSKIALDEVKPRPAREMIAYYQGEPVSEMGREQLIDVIMELGDAEKDRLDRQMNRSIADVRALTDMRFGGGGNAGAGSGGSILVDVDSAGAVKVKPVVEIRAVVPDFIKRMLTANKRPKSCHHPDEARIRGGHDGSTLPRMPLLYGSAEVEKCALCERWRMVAHSPREWHEGPYADAYAKAVEMEKEGHENR